MSTAETGVTAPGSAVRRGLLLALAGVVMFSFTLPLTKIALRGFDPWRWRRWAPRGRDVRR